MIEIKYYDEVYIHIVCDAGIAQELHDKFTFFVPGAHFMPGFKNKTWDGKIRLFNLWSKTIYRGLLYEIVSHAKRFDYQIKIDPRIAETEDITPEEITNFMRDELQPHYDKKPITPYSYQVQAVYNCVSKNRGVLLSPTSSGKSLIIYSLIRYYQKRINNKCLVIVPTTGLISQMLHDFQEYSFKDSSWDVEEECHIIMAGKEKQTEKNVVVSTWQSLYKMKEDYFKQYGMVIIDECHLAKAKSLTAIMEKTIECRYKFGTTGTLEESQTHKMVLEGLFGKIYQVTTTKELMDKGIVSKLKINNIVLKHPEEICKEVKKLTYKQEIDIVTNSSKRNNFITNLALAQTGNSLVIFNFEKHGKELVRILEEKNRDNKEIFLIYGKTETEIRENVRRLTEDIDNAIIVASVGVFSTGISIRNLQALIMTHPYKGKIRNLQSIGRILRLDDKGNVAKLYDIADDMRYKKYDNFGYKHLINRLKIYDNEHFDYRIVEISL